MGRGTVGTGMSGMMAPLAMAQNFVGDYYSGPSGMAIGALQLGNQLGEAFRDMGAASRDRQLYADKQAEVERGRMDELNQRQAVAQAINPNMVMQSADGMSNRDMTRKMALPDASTQMGIYGLQQKKQEKIDADLLGKRKNLATSYLAQGGKDIAGFIEKFKFDPYEYADPNTITRVEENALNRESREQMAREGRENTRLISEATRATKEQSGAAKLSDVNTTRSAYMRDSGTFLAQRDGFQRVLNGAKEDNAVGDLKIIFGYMKLLDPTSVVREGEFANAENAQGIPDRVRNLYNKAVNGERLVPEKRQEFVASSYNEYGQSKANHGNIAKSYGSLADRYGVARDDIMPDLYSESDGAWDSFQKEVAERNKPKPINQYDGKPTSNGRPPLSAFGGK